MSFAAPALLWGLSAAALPLLLHLLRRHPPRPTAFPAIVLLGGRLARAHRRRRLRAGLLLLVRMLLLGGLALALARPYTETRLRVPPGAHARQAAVILLDDSASLRATREGQSLFRRARARARALLEALPFDAPTALLTLSGTGAEVAFLCEDRVRLRRALHRMEPTFRRGDTARGLRRALALLARAPSGLPRAIYLVTDGTASSALSRGVQIPPDVAVRLVRLARPPLANLAVVDARAARARGPAEPAYTVRVTLLRTGGPDRPVTARLTAGLQGNPWAERTVRLERDARVRVTLRLPAGRLRKGTRFAWLRLAPRGEPAAAVNALGVDDVRLVPLGPGPPLRLVLADGDPREVRHEDELFYLESAIRAVLDRGRRDLRVVSPTDLGSVPLEGVDLLVLANVATLPAEAGRRIVRYVRQGGALWITLGDQVRPALAAMDPGRAGAHRATGADAGAYPDALAALAPVLPASVRSFWTHPAGRARSGVASRAPAPQDGPPAPRLDPASARGPFAELFSDPKTRLALRGGQVYRYGLLDGVRGQVLLRLTSGAPLLVAGRAGAGVVWLYTTTIDRDWTALVHTPIFVPLVRRALEGLTHRLRVATGGPLVTAGQERLLRGLPGETLVVRGPGDRTWRLGPASGAARLPFGHTEWPGLYRVASLGLPAAAPAPAAQARGRPLPEQDFGVVVDPRESDLRPAKALPEQPGRLGPGGRAESVTRRRDRTVPAALLVLLLLLLETLLCGRFGWGLRRHGPRGRRGAPLPGAPDAPGLDVPRSSS